MSVIVGYETGAKQGACNPATNTALPGDKTGVDVAVKEAALPAGAATAANQTTEISRLDSLLNRFETWLDDFSNTRYMMTGATVSSDNLTVVPLQNDTAVGGSGNLLATTLTRDAAGNALTSSNTAPTGSERGFHTRQVGPVSVAPDAIGSITGTITTVIDNVTLALSGRQSVVILIHGTYATFNGTFQLSFNGGSNYRTVVSAVQIDANTVTTTTGPISNVARAYRINCNGASHVRLLRASLTSGTVNVEMYASYFPCESVPGIQSHPVTLTSTSITSIVPGTGATNLGKAVNAVAGISDVGVAALAVRSDVPSTVAPINGDYVQLVTDSFGRQWVNDAAQREVSASVSASGATAVRSIQIGYATAGTRTTQVGSTATVIQVNTDATTLCRRGDVLYQTGGTFAQGQHQIAVVSAVTATTITLESPGYGIVPATGLTVAILRPRIVQTDGNGYTYVAQATTPWVATPYTGAKLNFESAESAFGSIPSSLGTVLTLGVDSVELNLSNTTDVELSFSIDSGATKHSIPADSQFKFTCTALGGNISASEDIQVMYETVAPTRGRFSVLSTHY